MNKSCKMGESGKKVETKIARAHQHWDFYKYCSIMRYTTQFGRVDSVCKISHYRFITPIRDKWESWDAESCMCVGECYF